MGAKRPVVIIDNDDDLFSNTGGDWNASTRDKRFHGQSYFWHAKGKGFEYMEPLDAPQPKRGRLLFKDDCDKMDNWFIEGGGEGKVVNRKLRIGPCPPEDGDRNYHVTIVKMGPRVRMLVDDQLVIYYIDDADPHNRPVYKVGKFGFRHRYHTIISYDNLRVYEARKPGKKLERD